jgi:GDSL-like Lipase/Acylhydrolase family
MRRRFGTTAAALAALLAAVMGWAPAAQAWPNGTSTAIVSLGDSYISGEAGRWRGNSINNTGHRNWTDRAAVCSTPPNCTYDANRVYLHGTNDNGCHRSDAAEILSARIPADLKLNLACSGAVSANIYRASNGGQAFKGEAPQAEQLRFISRAKNVKLIVLSVGGNDLGFAAIVQACLTAYLSFGPTCESTEKEAFNDQFIGVLGRVDKALKEIRATMAANGYRTSDYKLVLQSYPSVLPRSSENRYAERDPRRSAEGGCPFYDSDSDWARDEVVPQFARGWRAVALANGAQFLDLRNAFQGREFCSESSALVGVGGVGTSPDSRIHEWGRFVNESSLTQGEFQELFHPNAYGQIALGTCLELLWTRTGPSYSCTNQPGQGYRGMVLTASG